MCVVKYNKETQFTSNTFNENCSKNAEKNHSGLYTCSGVIGPVPIFAGLYYNSI